MENDDLTPEQEEAAFLAGFNGTKEQEEPPEKPPEPEKKEEAAPTQEEAPAPAFAGFTEAEIRSLFAKVGEFDAIKDQLAKAHGKIGELNRTLMESKQATTPTPSAPAVEPDDELETDYPEFAQIAEKRARKVLAEAMASKGETPDYQAMIQQATREVRTEMEIRLMDVMQPGWKDVVSSDDFKAWEAVQTDEVRRMFASTESAAELSAILGSYKDWTAKAKGHAQRNKNRLEAAVMPDGVPSKTTPALSDDDAFMAGFRAVRGR